MKYRLIVVIMTVGTLLTGCGGGDSSSSSQSGSATKQYGRQTQLSISDGELKTLQTVKYAANKGVGMRAPSNFEK